MFCSFVRSLARSKFFQNLVRVGAIDLVRKSSNFEPSSRFFGRLKIPLPTQQWATSLLSPHFFLVILKGKTLPAAQCNVTVDPMIINPLQTPKNSLRESCLVTLVYGSNIKFGQYCFSIILASLDQ